MERADVHLWIFKGLLGLLAIMALLVLVRQLGFYGVGHIHKIIMPIVLVACGAHVVNLVLKDPSYLRLDTLFLLLLLVAVFGILQGGVALALGERAYGLRQFIPHAFSAVSGLVIYLSFSNYRGDLAVFHRVASRVSPYILGTFAFMLALVYVVFLPRGGFYLGFSSDALLVPLALAIVARKHWLAVATVVLILLSGKRGVLIALPFMIALQFYFMKVSNRRLLAIGVAAAGVVAVAMAGALIAQQAGLSPPFLDKILLAINVLGQLDDPHALAVATSGRSIELARAAELLTQSGAWLTGLGFGFGFFLPNVSGDYVQYQHYVHVTPFNYVLQNGVLMAVGLYVMLGAVFLRAMRGARDSGSTAQRFLLLLVIGNLAISITAFMSGSDTMYWVLLGLTGAIAHRSTAASRVAAFSNAGAVPIAR
jgi:hypothetical protein